MQILQFLEQSKQADYEFVELPKVHPKTLRVMAERDWIFASTGIDGSTRYKITYRGVQALHIFEQHPRRFDNLCPSCCERPKHVYGTGRKAGYCRECLRDLAIRRYKRAGYGIRADRMCSRCRKFPVYVRPSGKVITYCLHCKNVMNRREKKRAHKRNLRRIAAGELIPCIRPGCNEPRYHSQKTVYDYCYAHYREYMNEYCRRKAAARPKKPIGRPKKVTTI
jgi:hypothetical protein